MTTTYIPRLKQHQRHVKRTPSAKQIKRRNAFKSCANIWQRLTTEKKNTWKAFAIDEETDYQAFMRCNIMRVYNDVAPVSHPDPSWL